MDVVTVGEMMVFLSPDKKGPLRYANNFSREFGGSESNVAIGLAKLGYQVGWISRIGNDEFGRALLSYIRGEGVEVSQVRIESQLPTGLQFREIRNQENHYYFYNKYSAASKLNKEDIDEDYISKTRYLYLTGLTANISSDATEMIFEAIRLAKKHNVSTLFDPNLRNITAVDQTTIENLRKIIKQVDTVIMSTEESNLLLGEKHPEKLGELLIKESLKDVVLKTLKGAYVLSANEHQFIPYDHLEVAKYSNIAEDGFVAGFLSGLLENENLSDSIDMGLKIRGFLNSLDEGIQGFPDFDTFLGGVAKK